MPAGKLLLQRKIIEYCNSITISRVRGFFKKHLLPVVMVIEFLVNPTDL